MASSFKASLRSENHQSLGINSGLLLLMHVDWLQGAHLAFHVFLLPRSFPYPTGSRQGAPSWSHHYHSASRYCAELFIWKQSGKKNHWASRQVRLRVLAGHTWFSPLDSQGEFNEIVLLFTQDERGYSHWDLQGWRYKTRKLLEMESVAVAVQMFVSLCTENST